MINETAALREAWRRVQGPHIRLGKELRPRRRKLATSCTEDDLDKGAAVDAASKNGQTSLYWAAGDGHEAMACILLDKGAAVDAVNKDGWTPLH